MSTIKTLLFSLASTALVAQGGLGVEEITITKEKEVKLQKANRIFEKIAVEESSKSQQKKELTYTFFEKKPQGIEKVEMNPNVVSPVDDKKRRSADGTGYQNYLKIGGGNYGRFYAETYINSAQDRNLIFGLYGLHNSAKRGPVQGANSGINVDQIKLDGKYHANKFELRGMAGYERRNYYFFGYDTTNYEFTKSDIRQRLNIFNVGVSLENTKPKPIVDYSLKTNLRSLNDFYDAEEVDWGTYFQANFPIIRDKLTAMLVSEAFLTQRSDAYFENPVRKRNLFRLEPSFNINFNAFNAKIGFKAVNEYNQVENINQTKGFPTVTLTYKTPQLYYFFAGYDGDIVRNTLGSMLDENPWLKPQVNLFNTIKDMEIFVGSRGDLVSGLSYNIRAGYGKFDGLYFFNTYDGDPKTRQFEVYYETNKTDFINVSTELNYQATDFWRANLQADYWHYQTIDFDKPYHRPSLQGQIGNTFIVSDKIVSNVDFYYIGSTFARDPFLEEDVKIPTIIDLNAEFTYLFSEQFSVFVKLNNIIGKNYQRYLNYPQMGLNFVAGLNISL